MAVEIKVPTAGESVTEATVGRWLKADGAAVRADEPVVEMETDKATQELAAPATGVLRIAVPAGQTVAVGAVIGRVEPGAAPSNGGAAAPARKPEPAASAPPTGSAPGPIAQPAPGTPPAPAPSFAQGPPVAPAAPVGVSPSARHLAATLGVDVAHLPGSGRGGRVTKEDVLAAAQARADGPAAPAPPTPAPAPAAAEARPAPEGRETRQRMSPIRQRIAERLLAAQQNAAILTTFNEADLSAVMALRARYKETFQKKHGVGLGFMSFFVKAAVEALRAFPAVNARIDGADIVYHNYYDIGVAVSTEKGLMVPVLRDADKLSFADVEKAIAALAAKARENKITVADLQGGTFTITNGGVFGSLLSTPILNPPQSAILGMHAIQKRPVAVGDEVVVRPMMYLALSYDHRLIDGREAVSFLVRVKECVEAPERLMLDV
jgi:2-oxoglutarate dehydrogenase E2 component (dihydrolipoamide succinyltransferase)